MDAVAGTAVAIEKPLTGMDLLEASTAKPKVIFETESAVTDDVVTFTCNKADFFAAVTPSQSMKTTGVTFALTGTVEYQNSKGVTKRASVACAGARCTVKVIND